MAQVDVRVSGPLFDGRAERILRDATEEAEQAVGEFAARELRTRIGREAAHPTGKWAGGLVVDRSRGDGLRVHRPGLRYTAWLEGTSRRNQRSRFKGHRLFREARQEVAARATGIADEVLHRRVKEING